MLLYAYKHVAGENNPVVEKLPTDLNGYSHQLLNNLGINPRFRLFVFWLFCYDISCSFSWAKDLRFYCNSSAHNRVIHFKTNNWKVIKMAYDGKGHPTVHDWRYKD